MANANWDLSSTHYIHYLNRGRGVRWRRSFLPWHIYISKREKGGKIMHTRNKAVKVAVWWLVVLCLFLVVSVSPVKRNTAHAATLLLDVPPDHWAYDFIYGIYDAYITSGCGANIFCPEDIATRDQMAAFIIRVLEGNSITICTTEPFSDVSTDNIFCKHIERVRDLGIALGFGDGRYGPFDPVTREQIAAALVRAVDMAEPPEDSCVTGSPFLDVSPVGWSCKYIKRLFELGITKGCGPGIYCPKDIVTRAQMAVFLWQAFLSQPTFQTSLVLKDANDAARNEFSAGENITFDLTITNITNTPRSLTLSTSQRYDFIVAGDPGTLWNWSHDKGFLLMITTMRFGPLETKTFREVWNQADNSGVQVPAGTYQAQGFIAIGREKFNLELSPESQTRSPAVTFTIN